MFQYNQPKKIKGKRKKDRAILVDKYKSLYPSWFDYKSDKEANAIIMAFKNSGLDDSQFLSFIIQYEKGSQSND